MSNSVTLNPFCAFSSSSAQRVESDAIGAAELGNPDFGDASPLSLSSAIGNILFVEI